MAIKLYYHKTTFQLITIDDGGESLIVGDDGSKVFEFYFGTGTALVDFVLDTTIPLTYEGRVIFERADAAKTNEVYLTPIAGGFYRYVIGDWVTAVDGDLKITARLKLGAVVTNFGIATIPVEDGIAPDDGSTVSQLQYDAVMGAVNEVIIGVTPIAYDNSSSGLAAVDVQGAIDEVDADVDALTVRVGTAETDINLLEGRADSLETFQTVTVPATYETISNVDLVKDRVEDLETFQEVTVPTTYETKADATSKLSNKVDKTTKVIGINLQDDILLTEFKTALGNATQSVAGLLSAEDKIHLDGLVALLESSDGNTVVDTIGEILEIFNNYPEGADLVTALNGKVDKVAGKGLSQNDFTDIDKNKVDLSYTHSEIVDGSNPHNTKFVNIADKPTTRDGYGITDVYTKPETYTQVEINNLLDNLSAVKGLKSTLLTPTELSNGDTISTNLLTNNGAFVVFTATNTSTGEIDSDTVPVSTIINGKKFVFFDNQEIVFTIGETNSTFETSEDVTLKINLLYLNNENVQAIDVDFNGNLTNYLLNQENVQSATNKLDEELKTTNDNSSNHITDINNPHLVTATQVGLGNVDNTSDLDKPISTLTQNALSDKSNVGHNHDDRYYTEEETNTLLNAKLNTSLKGAVNGLAELGSDGKVPSGQLPSYVDDVLEYTNLTAFPANGESGKIYVALDTNKTYRWSGSGYIEISASLAIGETSSTAGRGDWTKTAYDHTSLTNNPHSVTKAQVGLSNVDDTSDLDKPVSTAQQTSLNNKVDKNNAITAGTHPKITYDAKGLVTGGADLVASDIPQLEPSKITQDANNRFVTDNEKSTWNGKVTSNSAITGATKAKITYDSKGLVTAGADLVATDIPTLEISKITGLQTALDDKLDKNNAITAGTKTKITYDSKGLVTSGADLAESDIPTLPASKITQTSTARFVSDTEKSTWNSKQSALGFTPENQANKKTTLTDNDVDFPTTKAVKTAIDTAISQTLKPMGNWNASTNTPALSTPDINRTNQVWYVAVAGTQFGIAFGVGDELVYNVNGEVFKRDNVDSVISVNGKEGVVVLTQDDVADGSTYKRVTNTEKTTWNNKVTSNTAITGATKTKITYDAKGLVTAGADVAVADISGLQTALDGKAATSHTHGNVTNDGKIGTTENLVIQTGTGGVLTAKEAGTTSQFLRGDGAWATPPDNQGVTSITGTSPVVSSGGTTPAISLAANYGDTQNPYASKTAKYFLAAPNAANGAPTFREIVASDIPTLNQSTTGNAATATKLATARNLTIGPTAKSFDGSAVATWTLAEIGINVVTTCPTSAATAGQVNIYTGAACATKYDNWLYFETT